MFKNYALVTGAGEGLGKFLSFELAKKKFNLVLVSLPGSGLQHLQQFIIYTYHVDVLCYEMDLSDVQSCYRLYESVCRENISVSILINNAGMGGTFAFQEKEPAYYTKLIHLNVITPTLLCRLFLPGMAEQARAYIMNVSSLAGICHLPHKQVYGGTKSYLLAFSHCLRRELKRQNVNVTVLCPGGMNTYWRLMMQNRTMGTCLSRQSVMEPCDVAAIAIEKMLAGRHFIVPGFWNRCFLLWNRIFPQRLNDFLMDYQHRRSRTSIAVQSLPPSFITIKTQR